MRSASAPGADFLLSGMKKSLFLIGLLAVLVAACSKNSSTTAVPDNVAWRSKAVTLPASSYTRQQDSLQLLAYWNSFKTDVKSADIRNIAQKLPLDPLQKCVPFDSSFTENEKYWAYQTVLASWFEQEVACATEQLSFTFANAQNSMLEVSTSYQTDVRQNLLATHELKVIIVRQKNSLGITSARCQSSLNSKKAPL